MSEVMIVIDCFALKGKSCSSELGTLYVSRLFSVRESQRWLGDLLTDLRYLT